MDGPTRKGHGTDSYQLGTGEIEIDKDPGVRLSFLDNLCAFSCSMAYLLQSPIQTPVLYCLGDMGGLDLFGSFRVGDGAADFLAWRPFLPFFCPELVKKAALFHVVQITAINKIVRFDLLRSRVNLCDVVENRLMGLRVNSEPWL